MKTGKQVVLKLGKWHLEFFRDRSSEADFAYERGFEGGVNKSRAEMFNLETRLSNTEKDRDRWKTKYHSETIQHLTTIGRLKMLLTEEQWNAVNQTRNPLPRINRKHRRVDQPLKGGGE